MMVFDLSFMFNSLYHPCLSRGKKHNSHIFVFNQNPHITGIALIEKGKYDEGIELLNTIPDYDGVEQAIEEAQTTKQKEIFDSAIALMEKGKYDEGIELLSTIPDYDGVEQVLEEARYESYAFSAVNAVKGVLKNPDSISVYDLYFYRSRTEDNSAEESIDEDEVAESSSDATSAVDETETGYSYPVIIMYYGAQNGFGGNTTSYAMCEYNKASGKYELSGVTNKLDTSELNENDDNYYLYLASAFFINNYFNYGTEVGTIDSARFDTVLKNASYSAIKIID